MPVRKEFGEGIHDPADVAAKLIRQLPAPRTASPPIQRGRYTRNGQAPDIALINAMNMQTNQGVCYRTKEVFRATPSQYMLYPLPSSAGASRVRWRFAFRTGKYTHALRAVVVMSPQDTNQGANAYGRLDLATSTAATPVVETVNFYFGAAPGGTAGGTYGWDSIKAVTMYLDVDPDTDYYATFTDVNYCRMLSACVHELSSMTEHFSGYLPQNLAAGSDVLETYRRNLVTLQYNLWRRGGATVLNYTSDGDDAAAPYGTAPLVTTSLTARNLIDDTSTAVSAATPGYTLDMTGKERLSQSSTGVPCVMKAFGVMGSGSNLGRVYLKDSSGTTVASILDVWNSTAGWQSTTFNLPASAAKYDLHYARAASTDVGNPFQLCAVSIYEYEP